MTKGVKNFLCFFFIFAVILFLFEIWNVHKFSSILFPRILPVAWCLNYDSHDQISQEILLYFLH